MNHGLLSRLLGLSRCSIWLGSALLAGILTISAIAVTDLLLNGQIRPDFLLTGLLASLLLATLISGMIMFFFSQLSCLHQHISERKQIETELRIAATAFESQEGMFVTDADTVILKINKSFTDITGYSSEDAVGRKTNLLKSGVHDEHFFTQMWEAINSKGVWQGEIWNRRKNGDVFPEWLTISAVKGADGKVTHYVCAMLDITARKAIEQHVHHLAHHDALTDLPNRTLLIDRLHQAIAQARREQGRLAMLYLDLDRFKPVNDSFGHDIGDLLLKEVAVRLEACVKREADTVSRLGGDEFVVLLTRLDRQSAAGLVAENILQSLSLPFVIQQHRLEISSSIGIAIYPDAGLDANTLMKNADNAMYQAKCAGRDCFRYYVAVT